MGQYSELDIAIRECGELRLDLHRARLLLTTAKQLLREERSEINQLRRDLTNETRGHIEEAENLSRENELLRQQLFEVSSVRSRRLGLTPRDEQPATIPIMQDT
jgi:hypothetical protein